MSSGIDAHAPAGFVFEDLSGRRWLRLKRMAVCGGLAAVILVILLVFALFSLAPGKTAPWRSATSGADQVHDWPQRVPPVGGAVVGTGPGQSDAVEQVGLSADSLRLAYRAQKTVAGNSRPSPPAISARKSLAAPAAPISTPASAAPAAPAASRAAPASPAPAASAAPAPSPAPSASSAPSAPPAAAPPPVPPTPAPTTATVAPSQPPPARTPASTPNPTRTPSASAPPG